MAHIRNLINICNEQCREAHSCISGAKRVFIKAVTRIAMFDLELEIRTGNDQARCTKSPNAPAYISPTEETRKRKLGEREREREGGGLRWREECGVRGGEGSL